MNPFRRKQKILQNISYPPSSHEGMGKQHSKPGFISSLIPRWVLPGLLGLGIATVSLRLSVVKSTYELNELNREIKNRENEIQAKEYEIAKLESPQRLEKIAKSKFGWYPPKPNQVLTVQRKNK